MNLMAPGDASDDPKKDRKQRIIEKLAVIKEDMREWGQQTPEQIETDLEEYKKDRADRDRIVGKAIRAAEKSLAHRQANLDAIEEKLSQLESDSGVAAPHLRTEFAYRAGTVDQALRSEKDSIEQRDVFGRHVQLEYGDYETFAALNPFLDYLKVLMEDIPSNLVHAITWEWRGNIDYHVAEETLQEVTGIAGETGAEQEILGAILEGDIDLGAVLSRKKTLPQKDYLSWLKKAVEVAKSRGPEIKREAFTIAMEEVKRVAREKGFELADFDNEDIERLAAKAIEENPDITKEAERRVDLRSKLGVGELDLSSASHGESS